jgi:Na+/H+-dicarboxylate symporter
MTQHILQEHELDDQQTMRRLGLVIGCFILATGALAVAIGLTMG